MNYPSIVEVEAADHIQLCRWWRFLKSPGGRAIGKDDFNEVLEAEAAIVERIKTRLAEFGGFTPEISKQIGWGE